MLSTGSTHVTNFDFETLNPGAVGLVGYADLSHVHPNSMDQVGFLTVPPGATSGTIGLAQGQLTLPVYSNTTFTTHTVTNAASPFGSLSGIAYSNADGFAAYILGVDGDVTQPVYAITGETFADVPTVFQGTDLRRYTFTPDPIQQVPIPFFRSGDLSSYAGTVSTDFYIIETPSFAQADPKMFQASLAIEGAGFAQQSAIELTVADVFDNGGHYTAGTGRAGSYRGGATVASYHDYGGQDLLTNSTGSSDFYGANAENFLMTTSVDVDDAFGVASASLADPFSVFSTLHVANLAATTPVSSVTRTSRSLTGFSAGVLEVSPDNSTYQLAVLASPIDQPGIRMLLDPASNSLGGEISANDVFDLVEADQLHVAFGIGIDGNTQYGPSTLISDDMFGADENNDRTLGYVTTDSSGTYTQRSNLDPAVYMVSSEAVPQTGAAFWGTAQPCVCKFLEWGWWGAQLQTADPNGSPTEEAVRDSVHLGTWVAGDVVDYSELPTGGSATYNGHAVGSVVTNPGSGEGTYVAAGTMTMTWDFLPRTGTVSITNFDSHSFSGAVGDPAVPSDPSALFSGSLSGSGLSGTVNGAFVRNGTDAAGGVIGDFAVSGAGYAASGIIAGERAP